MTFEKIPIPGTDGWMDRRLFGASSAILTEEIRGISNLSCEMDDDDGLNLYDLCFIVLCT